MNSPSNTGAFSALDDEAIHAFTPAPARRGAPGPAAAAPPPPRRRVWPWVLLGLALLSGLLLTGSALVLSNLVEPEFTSGWHGVHADVEHDGLGTLLLVLSGLLAGGVAAVLATVMAVAAVLLLVPLGLALGLLGAALGLAAALFAALAVVAALLLPLWLPLLLLWLLLRPRRPAPAATARMPA